MSGVVVKLNDSDGDEEDEDDTGGLLSSRGYDEDDFDDEDSSGIGRHHGSGARRSVLKRLRGSGGGDGKKAPYPSLRSGTVMHLLNTLTICCIFFGMVIFFHSFSLGKALLSGF